MYDNKIKATIIPQIDVKLIPLITVKGLSFYTDDKTGNSENLDQNIFWNLKLINETAIIKHNTILEQNELWDFHWLYDISLQKILVNIIKFKIFKIRYTKMDMTNIYAYALYLNLSK